jgi:uncharacterized protein YdbL (DUF1318 family)
MKKRGKRLGASLLLVAWLAGSQAWALSLDEAKAAGLVGEQGDGYIGAVNPSSEVMQLVEDINRKRLEHYQGIAAKNNLDLNDVAKLAGTKLIEKAAPADMVKGAGGWKQKGQ